MTAPGCAGCAATSGPPGYAEPVSASRRPAPPVGLCDSCRHQQVVRTTRGSEFSLCRRSRDEPERFPRYPRLPVMQCPGYEPGEGTDATDGAEE